MEGDTKINLSPDLAIDDKLENIDNVLDIRNKIFASLLKEDE